MAKKKTFASMVRELREQRGWTQYRLAKECGLTNQAITDLEAGERRDPRWSTVRAIAQALGVSTAVFEEQS